SASAISSPCSSRSAVPLTTTLNASPSSQPSISTATEGLIVSSSSFVPGAVRNHRQPACTAKLMGKMSISAPAASAMRPIGASSRSSQHSRSSRISTASASPTMGNLLRVDDSRLPLGERSTPGTFGPGLRILLNGRMIVLIGLASAIVYGVSDFLGGLGSRRISPLLVSLVSFLVAVVPIALLTPLVGSVWSPEAVWLGAIAGLAGAGAIWAFYAALAIGPMSVISPTTAAVAALIPAVAGIGSGERFSPLGYVALGVLVVAAVLLGVTREQQGGRVGVRAVVLAVASGVGFGGYNVVMEATPPD